jgi:hypothetical protein
MMTLTEIVQAAHQLSPEERAALVYSLTRGDIVDEPVLTRTQALAEFEAMRASTSPSLTSSLYGKYAYPPLTVSKEELLSTIREASTEWKTELDDLDEK